MSISDELAAEEVTADFVGDMAYDEQTFDKYVESNKENTGLIASIARIFRSIADFFRNVGDKAHAKRLDNMTKKLDALIAASSEAVANGAQIEGVRYSISESQANAIIEAMKANAEVAPQIELTPENWAAEFGAEGVVSTPIGEVKMGANQYQKMDQSDRRTKLGMVKPTLTNPDVIIEELSKPKDGREPERNSSYVFVKAFTNADGTRDYMFTSVSNLRDGIEIVMSNQEKETPRIKRLLKEGKLAYINKATLPSEFTASAQGDQSTIPSEVSYSESKDTTSSPNMQEEGAKFSLREPIFYSNAEYAVRGIKQEKATPEQWLKMIEKNGGLKAGEDKWLGLSDWLKASDKKSLAKDEVLQYIAENDIQIEEVSYGDVADISREEIYESAEFAELREGLTEYDEDDNPYINRERYDELRSESYDFVDGFSLDYWGEELEVDSPAAAASYLGLTKADNEINETRLQYTTDGLTNKREIALVVPTIEPWNTSDNIHFGDAGEGRAVAWIRFGETTDADGKRVLVIDEIQSKRHQEGREKGYKTTEDELNIEDNGEVLIATYNGRKYFFARGTSYESIASSLGYEASLTDKDGVPPAPFEKNWAELAMKRMLRYAAENGFDKVAWTTGDQQAERYDLSEKVDSIIYKANDNGTYRVSAQVAGRGHMLGDEIPQQELSNYVGKELADRIINSEGYKTSVSVPWPDSPYEFEKTKVEEWNALSGGDLKVGGEGMKAFYDQMLPSFVRKYAKKWGATVGEVTMPDLEENKTMHSVDVTPAMRESVMQGQPKFSLRTMEELKGALDLYNKTSKIDNFVDAVKNISEGVGGNSYLQLIVGAYEEDNDENWFAERIYNIVRDFSGGYAPYTAGGVKYSISSSTEEFDATRDLAVQNIGIVMPNLETKRVPIVGYNGEERPPIEKSNEDVLGWAKKNIATAESYIIDSNGVRYDCPITANSLTEMLNDRAIKSSVNRNVHMLALPLLKTILANSIEVEIHPDYNKVGNERKPEFGYNPAILMHRFYGAVEIDSVVYRAKSTIKEYRDKNTALKPYTYEVTKIKLLPNSTADANDAHGRPLSIESNYIDATKLLQNVEKSYDKGVKILDESAKNSLRELDAPYLDAVERGDMETAQRMVLEAAKLAMPNTKVVDEDGNPKVVYHQTNASVYINRETGQNWDELDWRERMEWDERDDWDDYWEEREFNTFSRVNARTTNEFDGFFFAPNYDEYHEYGDRTIAAFLNITNPASNADYNIDSSKNNAGQEERMRLQREGYDGVIREYDGEIHEYIAFDPNQIKSADPVTYDDNGNVIPLSERFNPKREDIRYSVRNDDMPFFDDNGDVVIFNDLEDAPAEYTY